MKSLSQIFTLEDTFNRTKLHNCNFKCTQTIRLTMMITNLVFLIMVGYVWVKAAIGRILFYALAIWFLSLTVMAVSSGREVVEEKLLEKKKDKMRKDENANFETIASLELGADEKSTLWSKAVFMYALATPLVMSVPFMYLIFWEKMKEGEICKFYSLTSNPYLGEKPVV